MNQHSISKGFDIRIAGGAEAKLDQAPQPVLVAVDATEFPGIKPKLLVKDGDRVRTGDPLFFDKKDRDTVYVSPATGTVQEVVLGPRRVLQRVTVLPDAGDDDYAEIAHVGRDQLGAASREDLIQAIKQAGLWPLLRQRPIGRTADAAQTPVAIFIGGIDTEPMAADPAFCVMDQRAELEAGIALLRELVGDGGKLYLTVPVGKPAPIFEGLAGVEMHAFDGPHPAGLVGTHIAKIRPLKTGEVVWYLKAPELALLGSWVLTGRYPAHRVVAVAGSEAQKRQYYRVRQGSVVATLTGGAPLSDRVRVIRGTVLGGEAVGGDGFLGYRTWTLTAIPDGEGERDLVGWMLPQFGKHSVSRSVWSWLTPKDEYELDARVHGGPRNIVNIGAWESMTPLDILPTFLVRAIQANDLEGALELGLLEVTEEDVALCTFADPCKIEIGSIIRQGLDLYEAES